MSNPQSKPGDAGEAMGSSADAPVSSPKIWVVHPDDNVGTVVGGDISGIGTVPMAGAGSGVVDVRDPVPYGHKVALRALAAGDEIIKYGVPVGRLSAAAGQGRHVHVHNLESQRGRGDLAARD